MSQEERADDRRRRPRSPRRGSWRWRWPALAHARARPTRTARAGAVGADRRHARPTIPRTSIVTATGDVEISTGQRRLLADEVRYDQRTDKIFASGNVVLIEPNGDAIFGDEVEVTGDLREGFVQAVGMLLKDNSRIAADAGARAARATSSSSTARSTRPARSADDGKGGPLWQIKARRVILDETGARRSPTATPGWRCSACPSRTRPGSATRPRA